MSFQTSITCLKAFSVLTILLGTFFAWTTTGPLAGYSLVLVDFIVGPFDGGQSYAAAETRVLAAISGGLTAGLAMFVWMVTHHIYAHNQVVGRQIIVTSVITWFVVDSVGSVLAGVAFNALANVSFLLMFVAPVLLVSSREKTQAA